MMDIDKQIHLIIIRIYLQSVKLVIIQVKWTHTILEEFCIRFFGQ